MAATYSQIQKGGSGWAWCSGNKVDPAEACAVMVAAGLDPLVPYPGAVMPWPARCVSCGREVAPLYNNVQQGNGGCKFCSTHGLEYTAPGVVYLLIHRPFHALKVGVTTSSARSSRIVAHEVSGWESVATWAVATGEVALAVEAAVLDWWRSGLGAPPAVPKADMPSGGWSETASLLWVDIDESVARIQREVDRLA